MLVRRAEGQLDVGGSGGSTYDISGGTLNVLGDKEMSIGKSGLGTEDSEENVRKAERLTEYFAETLPLKRAGLPEDIAGAAVFLASDESLHTTGHNLKVDSGITVGWNRAYAVADTTERERRLGLRD